MLTNDNKEGRGAGNAALEAENATLEAEAAKVDALAERKDMAHMLPRAEAPGARAILAERREDKAHDGSKALKNARQEEFCEVLTGWGGDGKRKTNYEAYTLVYGSKGGSARASSSKLLARPEVAARVRFLAKEVAKARRHDYLAAQQSIDELRLHIIDRAKNNIKLAPVALMAARDFEKAHGLDEKPEEDAQTTEIAAIEQSDARTGVRAILARVTKGSAQ